VDINEMLEESRGGILALAKKHGIIGMTITGSDDGCEAFDNGAFEFLVEFAPDASPAVREEFQRELLGLLGRSVELASAEDRDGHLRRIAIKESFPE
jgi:hypothetical protein